MREEEGCGWFGNAGIQRSSHPKKLPMHQSITRILGLPVADAEDKVCLPDLQTPRKMPVIMSCATRRCRVLSHLVPVDSLRKKNPTSVSSFSSLL